jgi:nitrite reductase/ring-hydroxylating ferredoxin subunit
VQLNKKGDAGFTELCSVNDLNEAQGKRFIVDETEVALFKVNSNVFAVGNICPHQHTALIYNGFVEDVYVVCPAHGWMFDLRTGKTPSGSRGLEQYEVKIVGDKVFVNVNKKEFKW